MRSNSAVSARALLALVFVALSTVSSAASAAPPDGSLEFPFVPDPNMTTGSTCTTSDPDFDRLRYGEQIPYCARNVSREEKALIYEAYGVPSRCRKEYTIDHFIPLSLGGTNHRDNLWPEAKSIKALRQDLELDLYKKMSQGQVTQAEAIKIIVDAKLRPPVNQPDRFKFCR